MNLSKDIKSLDETFWGCILWGHIIAAPPHQNTRLLTGTVTQLKLKKRIIYSIKTGIFKPYRNIRHGI
jgi:hypothetical protein